MIAGIGKVWDKRYATIPEARRGHLESAGEMIQNAIDRQKCNRRSLRQQIHGAARTDTRGPREPRRCASVMATLNTLPTTGGCAYPQQQETEQASL